MLRTAGIVLALLVCAGCRDDGLRADVERQVEARSNGAIVADCGPLGRGRTSICDLRSPTDDGGMVYEGCLIFVTRNGLVQESSDGKCDLDHPGPGQP